MKEHTNIQAMDSKGEPWRELLLGKAHTHKAILSQIETFRKIVLNPLSHATPTTVTRMEIQGAIDAVEALKLWASR